MRYVGCNGERGLELHHRADHRLRVPAVLDALQRANKPMWQLEHPTFHAGC